MQTSTLLDLLYFRARRLRLSLYRAGQEWVLEDAGNVKLGAWPAVDESVREIASAMDAIEYPNGKPVRFSPPSPMPDTPRPDAAPAPERAYPTDTSAPDLSVCPGCGGLADNGHDRCLPPSPYFCTRCESVPEHLRAAWDSLSDEWQDFTTLQSHGRDYNALVLMGLAEHEFIDRRHLDDADAKTAPPDGKYLYRRAPQP